jgi:L-alanine-DL-glutamate epimerase-like enolase superfamily enzyme
MAQLRDQCSDWVADGITRVKMKIGRHPDEDLDRVSVVRKDVEGSHGIYTDDKTTRQTTGLP